MSVTVLETPKVQLAGPPGQPDIDYAPDLDKYLARVKRRQANEDLPRTLPDGFPKRLESELVWDGATVGKEYQWSYQLTDQDIEEIDQALKHFQCDSHS